MARIINTRRTHKMTTRSMKKAKPTISEAVFKAHALDHIISNYYREQNETLTIERELLYTHLSALAERCEVQATRLSRQEALLNIAQRNARLQHEELAWHDQLLHEILAQDAHLRWLLRDRVSYSDLPLYDPDAPSPSQASTIEDLDDDFEQRTLEDELQHQMEQDLD